MKAWTLEMPGLKELAERLGQLPKALSDEVQKKALIRAAEPMRKKMADLAPRGPIAPHLADHIGVSSPKPDNTGGFFVNVGPEKDFFYGRFLEFGTKHMAAQPFARPAFDSEAETALEILREAYWDALRSGLSFGGSTL